MRARVRSVDGKAGLEDAAGAAGQAAQAHGREKMPAEVRRARIVASVERAGFVSVSSLAGELGVSHMTIRRDVSLLESRGKFQRTHGGAIAGERLSKLGYDEDEPAFEQRMRRHAAAKSAIAKAAAALIGQSESVGLDVGTSVLALATAIGGRDDLRIFTNNLRAALSLARSGSEVYMLGGKIRGAEYSIVGSGAVDQLHSHFLDRVFIGVSGVDGSGLYDYSPEDTEVKRALMANAGRVVVLCDASKFGRRALARVAPLNAVSTLVTDGPPPDDIAAELDRHGVEVVLAR
jgi:DeoR/GlpR family transcriptional regulator of sugar metabolism